MTYKESCGHSTISKMEMILRIYPYHYFAVYKSIFISSCTVGFSFFKFSACPTSAKFQWLCPNHFQHTCALLLCQDSSLQSQGPVKAPGEGTSLGEVNLEGYRLRKFRKTTSKIINVHLSLVQMYECPLAINWRLLIQRKNGGWRNVEGIPGASSIKIINLPSFAR